MNYYSEDDIREIVKGVLAKASRDWNKTENPKGQEVPVEISARHVHLTQEAVDVLFGKGYILTKKRSLSQPGQYLAEERVKLVTAKGQLSNIAILGPVRPELLGPVRPNMTGCWRSSRISGKIRIPADG